MGWDETEFTKNASGPVYKRYTMDNSWFKWGNNPKDEDEKRHISDAWKLYRAASQNTLEFLILGDDKIRKSPDLLMNFGLASGSGVSAKEELEEIKKQEQKRAAAAAGASAKVGQISVNVGSKPGSAGSILNDDGWTPMLNDAYVLAGVHGRQEFQWAAEGVDAEFGASNLSDFEKWKSYAVKHSVFWGDDGQAKGVVPRVFGREVIGLKTFGYLPRFTKLNIIFKWSYQPKVSPTFDSYLTALQAVKFDKKDKASINGTLGEFLFGDSDALTTP